jgi:hypothetical protein
MMAITENNQTAQFVQRINGAVQEAVQAIAEEEITAAQKRIAERVRERVAFISCRVAEWVEVSTLRDRIVIEVKTDKFKL